MVLANTKTTNQSKDQHMEKTKLDFIKKIGLHGTLKQLT